jgi:bile acid:Na+ symporter, BASS family
MTNLFTNRNFIFILAICLAMVFPGIAVWTEPLALPALALAMMLAALNVSNDFFRKPQTMIKPALTGIILTYALQGGLIIMLSLLLIGHKNLWTGLVLVAVSPPAVAVIPFTGILAGNVAYSLIGTVASYLAALIIMPLIFLLILGVDIAEPGKLVVIMLELIVLPLILSRMIIYLNFHKQIAKYRGVITDWSFFLVLYTIIGLNRKLIFSSPQMIMPIAMIFFISFFLLGYFIEKVSSILKIDQKDAVSMTLLGTLKNQGIAGGLAISLFSREAAFPAAVSSIVMILFLIWLDIRKKWRFQNSAN